jgi:excisionase family DNA binding protein
MAKKKVTEATAFKDMPEIMTPAQVQDLLQISRATFFRWVGEDKLPGAVKIGDSWRVTRDTLKQHFYPTK